MEFNFTVKGDRLRLKNGAVAISGNANAYVCNFEFSDDYLGLSSFAVFSSGEEFYTVEIKDCTCVVPSEAISGEGIMQVGVFATNALAEDFKRLSTNYVGINIETGAYSIYSQPKTPDIWESYLLQVTNERKAAEEASKLAAKNTADETAVMLQAEIDAAKKECSEAASNANAAAARVTEPLSAENISYDNSQSELSSVNAGGAITELATLHKANAEAIVKNKADAEKGLAEVKEASALQFSNALKGAASGEAIRVDDVSPVSHNISVKVRSKNLWDESAIRLNTGWSKVDGGYSFIRPDSYTGGSYLNISKTINIPKGTTVTFSATRTGGTSYIYLYKEKVYGTALVNSRSSAVTYTATEDINIMPCIIVDSTISNVTITDIQFEIGNEATECTPYVDITNSDIQLELGNTKTEYEQGTPMTVFTPNADGVVEDIRSISPTMTLTTDKEGVIIDLEYNKDLNKVIEEITSAIISLGGNV